ncbi:MULTISPECIES: hypothetical protein [Arthrobacter]|uniref:Uncharacterized protein n=1 Tax=Arthrobacter oryzae TaxID=409290 RepID=A0A3N0C8F6_9MICC|nr:MULTISPECIES: hypothetical protein [Arthrobacter]QYF89002.1 hypothetical protein KY499_12540 [Arthrobacter sp. PAMC25284]RNL59750.1 hypothetical protein D7003_01925 [Arthrobacter oryzae]
MQFDLSAVETGTMVFLGTLVFGMVIAFLMAAAAFAALLLAGAGRLVWLSAAGILPALVHSINRGWDRLVHHAANVDLTGDFSAEFPGQQAPSTGTYPRVVLRDS